jgi:two-component system, LytTR family, response regulator
MSEVRKIRIIIADDERPARKFLRALLEEMNDVEILAEAENGAEAVDAIRELSPDFVLLDLEMPVMGGIEAVRSLSKEEMPLVGFVTAFDGYAVQAFEVNAVDYLLKPVDPERLRETIDRAKERLNDDSWRSNESDAIKNVADDYEQVRREGFLERIPVKDREDIILIPVSDVSSISADGELLHIVTVANSRHIINHRLKDLELRLDPSRFVRLSRSAIVAIDEVDRVTPMPGGTFAVIMKGGLEFQSSRIQSRILRDKILRI